MLIEVDDPRDPRLADYLDLRGTPARHPVIVEGAIALEQVPGSPFALRSVLCLAKHVDKVRSVVADDVALYVAALDVLRETVGFDLHRGVVAALDRPPPCSIDEVLPAARFVAVLERLNDLENLGVIFRNARALGVDAVLLDPQTPDPLNRRTVRVSLGHVLRVPFSRFEAWPPRLDGFTVVALTPGGAVDIREVDARGRIALLLGAEGDGLTDAALAIADVRARIAMRPGVDSLNVASAAAIAFYELSRR